MQNKIIKRTGKGSKSEVLPNRHTMSKLTGGEAWERSMGNYAKSTPSGEGAEGAPSVLDMAAIKY